MSENKHNRFAEILRAEREKRNMTLEQMANLLGTTKQVLSRYERGERNPKLITAALFAQKLGIPIEAFERDIEYPKAIAHTIKLSESNAKMGEFILLFQKHADAIELLESLSDGKRKQAIDYLRYLSTQQDNE